MTGSPRVSVVIPIYNAEAYVGEALDSVLRQTFGDFELLAIDDGSTDRSADVVLARNDARIRLVRNAENLGLAGVRNLALSAVRGEYIAWLDADDVSLPPRLERQVALLDDDASLAMCGTWVRTLGTTQPREWHYPTAPDVIRARFLFDDPFATSSVMIRRSILGDALRFEMAYPPAEDYDLWERVSAGHRTANVPEVLTLYRVHAMQTSRAKAESQRRAIWAIQARQLARLGIAASDDERELHLDIGAAWAFDQPLVKVAKAAAWLERLERANQSTRQYDLHAFRSVLFERWLGVCHASAHHGWAVWRRFWESPLSRFGTLGARRRAGFLARSILRLRPHGTT